MKVLKTAVIIVAVILVGGLIYETMVGYISHRRANALITSYVADNKRIGDRLVEAENRGTNLERTVEDLERRNCELGKQLTESKELAADLSTENRRLGEALSDSESTAGSISVVSRELGEAIGRAWNIIERYEITTETE